MRTAVHLNYLLSLPSACRESMKESVERIDSAAMFLVMGERQRGMQDVLRSRRQFEEELKVQEGNITEPGEKEATEQLRKRWENYQTRLDPFIQPGNPAPDPTPNALRRRYVSELNPSFAEVKDAADAVLNLNQDAMVRKSDLLRQRSEQVNHLTILGVLTAFLIGWWLSIAMTQTALRPVSVLSQAVQRLGKGDLEARVKIDEKSELGQLAVQFNAMADKLKQYRESSLGELLQAQQSAQATIDSLPDPVIIFGLDGSTENQPVG